MGNKYAGMTVNECLYVSGLINEFDKAVEEKNVRKIRKILERVDLTEDSIKPILEKLGIDVD